MAMKGSELLKYVGLDESESKVYLALLDLGPSNISAIAKKAKIHRPVLYKLLPTLEGRGIVSQVVKKKRHLYAAESPEKLKQLFEVASKTFDGAMPDLMRMYIPKGKQPVIKFFEGQRGIAQAFEDFATSLRPGSIYYRYNSIKKPHGRKSNYLPQSYDALMKVKSKTAKGFIIANKLISDTQHNENATQGQVWKVIPASLDIFSHNITQQIYEGKVAYIDYNSNSAFIIESKEFAEFQKSIFKLFWDRLPDFGDEEE
jgi:predicted transcriptional regulator